MPWCPKCKTEYDENCTSCPDCKCELMENPPEEQLCDIALLTTVHGSIEADVIQSLLDSYQIPSMQKHHNIQGFVQIYTGSTTFDIDIFVPETALKQATDIIKNEFDELPEEFCTAEEEEAPAKKKWWQFYK